MALRFRGSGLGIEKLRPSALAWVLAEVDLDGFEWVYGCKR